MSNHKKDLMDLHLAAVAGTLLSTRPEQAVADHDAEPELYEERRGALRRLVASVRARRSGASRPETSPS
jgi:hypothetical protein